MGEIQRAIEFHEQALAINREIGRRGGEAANLGNLAGVHGDLDAWEPAVQFSQEAIVLADEIGLARSRVLNRLIAATVYLHACDFDAAREIADAARAFDYPGPRAEISVVLGIALSRLGQAEGARQAFSDALEFANTRLETTNGDYRALDTKALALCGLALVVDPGRLTEARAAFGASRSMVRAEGIVRQVLRLFDTLAASDEAGVLRPIRRPAAGDGA